MFNKGTHLFLTSSAAAQAVLAALTLANKAAASGFPDFYNRPMRKSQPLLTDGTPSETFVRRTRQMERSEMRRANKGLYRRIRATVAFERKTIGRDVASINSRMFA